MISAHEPRTYGRPLSTSTLDEADRASPERRSFGEPLLAAGQVTYPLTTRSGAELSITLSLDPVQSLEKGATVAMRVHETVRVGSCGRPLEPAERPHLDLVDVERMDCEAYHRGMKLLNEAGVGIGVISTSYRTLARAAGRFAYLTACLEAPLNSQTVVFAELTDVDAFTPRERLAEVAALIRVHRQGVMVKLDRNPATLQTLLGDLSLAGASLEAGGTHGLNSATWPPFRSYLRAVKSVVPMVMLDHLEPTWANAAHEAGATHAVFAACEGVRV